VLLLLIAAWGTFFFLRSQVVLEQQTRSRLTEIAAIAAVRIDGGLMKKIRGPEDAGKPAYRQLLKELRAVRDASSFLKSVYVLRKTDDPGILAFVADASAADTTERLDENGDGIVEENERAALPGELYDIRQAPAMLAAFERPSADPEIVKDLWGKTVSGYAPVRDGGDNVVGIIGVDMEADDFVALSQSIFSPVAFLLALAGAVILAVTLLLSSWRRRIEDLEEMEHERSALLDLLLHQLGAPIATFKWWLEIFRERGECAKYEDICQNFEESSARMTGILAAMAEAQRTANGGKRERVQAIDLSVVVKEATNEASARMKVRKHAIQYIADPEPGSVKIDRDAFAAVARELLDNAQSYAPVGSTITVRLWRQLRHVHLSVEDRGCGILPEDLPHIGERFVRGKNAHKLQPVGNGLGLFIAKRIIESAGGSLRVESEFGKGTIITVSLPVAA
jgi:signal transduction histidine kinase